MSSTLNFVRQQGFEDATTQSSGVQFQSLMWQPRLMALLVPFGLLLETGWYYIALGAVLWWSALVPRLSPFDAIYNRVVARRRNRQPLTPARGPRRLSQVLGGIFMMAIGLLMRAGRIQMAWTVFWIFILFLVLQVIGRFCAGASMFYLLTGKLAYLRRTMPWSHSE